MNFDMRGYFILDENHNPIPINDLDAWGRWNTAENRRVAITQDDDELTVSTVFLGIDHSFAFKQGTPILFETMIFGGPLDQYQMRYATWDEAIEGHKKAVELATLAALGELTNEEIERLV